MCIEPSLGADRVTLAFLCDAYDEEDDSMRRMTCASCCTCIRRWRRFKALCPAAVQESSAEPADEVLQQELASISWWIMTTPAPSASVTAVRTRSARRSASPMTLTAQEDGCVTVRDRDTMEQERMKIEELAGYLSGKIAF